MFISLALAARRLHSLFRKTARDPAGIGASSMPALRRHVVAAIVIPSAVAAFSAIPAGPARAHAMLEIAEASPGATWRAVLRIGHGCAGSPTTRLAVSLPQGIEDAKPLAKPGWTVAVETEGGHIARIVWSGGPLPDDHSGEFAFVATIARDAAPGTALAFPVTQDCLKGSQRWADLPAKGQDPHGLKSPAPLLRIVAASDGVGAGALRLSKPWTRATPPGASVAAGYLWIANQGGEADRLVSLSSPVAGRVELHEMSMTGGTMTMRPLADGLVIAPGDTVTLKPGGLHLMLLGLKAPIKEGDQIPATLVFEKAGPVTVTLQAQGVGAKAPAAEEDTHRHSHGSP